MEKKKYAGFWLRLAAYLLDSIIIGLVFWGGSALTGFGSPGIDGRLGLSYWLYAAFSAAATWLYFALLESSKNQATLGKMALGVKVIDMKGGRITFARATGRHFAKILSGLILGVGYLMIAFTEKKQGLHDILAKTLVVKK